MRTIATLVACLSAGTTAKGGRDGRAPWVWLLALLAAVPPTAALTLRSDRLEAELDEGTGMVTSLVDRRDGTRLLLASPDRYALQPTPNQEVLATESEDQVVAHRGEATFVATNPRLPGLTVTKTYTLTDRWLAKRVELSTDRRDLGLLKHTATSAVDPGFYHDGYLNDPSRHPVEYPYILTRDLTEDRPIRDSHAVADHHWAIFTNLAKGRGLAQYRFKVDGRYVHPLSSYAYEPGLTYGPAGWQVALACKWLSNDRPSLSDETRWQLFDGDQIAFQREYTQLPEVRAEWADPVPEWVKDVRFIAGWSYGSSSFHLEPYQQLVESFDDGYLLVMIGGVFTNTRRYLDDPLLTPDGLSMPSAELRRVVDGLHAISPRIKVGPMTWQWAFGDLDPVYREHPEWTVHDGAGNPVFAATGWSDEKVYSQLLTPPAREHNLAQLRGMIERYDFDFVYMDTGQGGVTRFDWTTHQSAQDYDWADFYRGIRDATRAHHDGIAFFNGTPGLYSQFADCGYFEGMGFVKTRRWQAMADRILLVKLYQPGIRWTAPLYWRDDNLEEYLNYSYLLGLKPGNFGGLMPSNRWPMIEAARELLDARLVPEAEARPCWWRETTEAEVYALSVPGGALLNVYWHGGETGIVRASCLAAPLGLDPAKPVHAWLFEPKSCRQLLDEVRLTEHDAHELFRAAGVAAHRAMRATFLGNSTAREGRLEVELRLDPEHIGLVLLTQADRLAHVVNGRPTQLLLPPREGDRVETIAADQAEPAELVARRYAYQLPPGRRSPELLPEHSSPATVNRQAVDVARDVAGLSVARLITIDCEHNPLDQASAGVEQEGVRLIADMADYKLYGFASAGVESPNLGRLTLRVILAKPLFGRFATVPTAFAGLTADYRVDGHYTHRVHFALVPCRSEALATTRPWWGAFDNLGAAPPVQFVDLTDRAKPGEPVELTLDLGRYAPEGWDGTVLFGPALDSCGLGSKLEVEILGNGPPGERDPAGFSPLPTVPVAGGEAVYQGATIVRFEDGARLVDPEIVFPAEGCIEAVGLRVVTWRLRRTAESRQATLMINFQVAGGTYELVYRDLGQYVQPGSETRFDLDLGQFAPAGWNGRVRIRLRGDGLDCALVGNSTFQPF